MDEEETPLPLPPDLQELWDWSTGKDDKPDWRDHFKDAEPSK
jgi:hypothetical protein